MLQIREELGPKTLKRHFQTDMSFGVEEVDMVRGFGRKEARQQQQLGSSRAVALFTGHVYCTMTSKHACHMHVSSRYVAEPSFERPAGWAVQLLA